MNRNKLSRSYLKYFFFLIVILICNQKPVAQTSYEDSLFFTTVFQTPVYWNYYLFPGVAYLHPFVQTRARLFDSLDNLMKFSGPEYYGAYDNIQINNLSPVDSINNTLNSYYSINASYGYKQDDPVWQLPFSLNGEKSTTYCTYTPATGNSNLSDCKTAVLFITGSGTNNGTEMVRGEGYQNIYGFLKDSLATLGDVYIAIRPLIDFRAYVWDRENNAMALNSEFPIPGQISNYLNGRGTPYGVNCLIESIALVKYLKSKYQRVVIAGLSYGGIYTTLNALESGPEGALISGGYTIILDETSQTNDYQLASFGPLFYSLNRDSVKNNINKTTTQFLFSWGRGGDITQETDLHYTENYFTGLTNAQYFYDYDLHTFPPFVGFKNLFDSVNIRSSVRIKQIAKTCDPPSAKIMITFCGQKPYHFDLYKDSALYNSYTSVGDTFYVDINEGGLYKIKNLLDNNNIPGFNSDDYLFKPNNNINIALVKKTWTCNVLQENKFKLTGGRGPWDVYYRENGISKSKIFYTDDFLKFSWPDGVYIIDSINNYGNCMKNINDTIVVDSNISASEKLFNTISFNCDVNKMQLSLKDYFNGFKEIFFNKDGIADSASIENNIILLNSGNYEFTAIKDDSDCKLNLNVSYSIKPNTLDAYNIYIDNWEIKTDSPGLQYIWFYNGQPFDTTLAPQTAFIGNGTYKVEIINNNDCLTHTESAYFNQGDLIAFPNPFNKQFNLLISLPSNEHAVLDIFNAVGKKIKSLEIKNGINSISMTGNEKGTYFLKVRYKGKGYSFNTLKIIRL
jgi:hypothetical protein